MKKVFSTLMALFAVISLFTAAGCSGKKSAYAEDGLNPDVEYADYEFIDPENFFTLDFRGEIPEAPSVPGKIDISGSGATGDSTSVIPGLRSLDKYQTQYNTKRLSVEEYLAAMAKNKKEGRKITYGSGSASSQSATSSGSEPEAESENDDFYVYNWGPGLSVPGEMENPQFYVEFSLPAKALTALTDQDKINAEAKKIMTITPEVKGNYRWYGTKNLSFEATEPLDPCVSYTISVSPSTTSAGGKSITRTLTFSTKTASARVVSLNPGVTKENQSYYYNSDSGLPAADAKYFKISFNYFFTPEEVYSRVALFTQPSSGSTKELSYSLTAETDSSRAKVSKDKKKSNTFYVSINDPVENDSTIQISFNTGSSVTKNYYRTLVPFKVVSAKDYMGRGYGTAARFEFNQPVDSSTLLSAFNCSTQDLTSDNFSCWGKTVTVQYLKAKPGQKTTISVNNNLKNSYGFNLTKTDSVSMVAKDYQGYARYIDSGNKIMEAQFPHKILFEYMNAQNGAYRISSTSNPLEYVGWNNRFKAGQSGSIWIDTSSRNTREFIEIDLDPYLVNGKGAVRFEADVATSYINWQGYEDTQNNTNFLNIQVTDLAATARIGINRAVIMVRSMEHNTPVAGASVYITNTENGLHTQTVKTDANGLAVINLSSKDQSYIRSWDSQDGIVVNVETSDDKVMFKPSTHSSWGSGVYTRPLYDALKPVQRTFMFSDRGLYKPGETITFRGIDRNQKLGSFVPYTGSCFMVLEKRSWRGNVTYATKSGTTSKEGGFYGSFDLPSNLEPGDYCISYYRGTSSNGDDYRSLYFTVAYFEPLKFQAESSITNKTAYAGDVLNADVAASYLAGGSLAGATYETTWYTEPSSFEPSRPETKKYRYGINDNYDYRRSVSEQEGKLSRDGKTKISCQTGNDLKYIPYTYRAETYITDVSNQRISTAATKVVHPAFFYIGIGKPENHRGFAKAGETLKIPFVLAGPDEFILNDTKLVSGSLSYELSREYWTYNYQNSVDSGVYSRYEKHVDVEKTGTISAATKGTFSISPKNAGWYTLRVTGKDTKGRTAGTDYCFYVTGTGASWYDSSDSAELKLTPDQTMYNPGDTAQILLESPLPSGDYLITVEREGIFSQEIRHFDQSCDVIDVQIARNYVPVVYVSVSSYSVREGQPVHDYGETDIDKPKGYYGVTPLFINPLVRAFSVKVETDKKVYQPGEMATVTLTATKGGKPVAGAELTAFAADRAVLDLINYHVPNPLDYFYDTYNFPLRVRGGDSRSYLMDPVTYSIKNLKGGDADEEKDEDERSDFRPTAFFEPVLVTDSNGKATCTFKVPDNLSTFRITAFGVKDELLALQEDEFAVQNPVNVQAVQPRRMRVRDTAECGVVITNLDNIPHNVTVSISIRDPKQAKADTAKGIITVAGKAFVDGSNSNTVSVAAGGSTVVYFDVAAEKEGNIELVYEVKSDILNEKLVSKVIIEQTYCMETVALKGATEYAEGGEKSATEYLQIPGFAKDGVGSLKVTLDATQLGLLGGAVNYVFNYPYGCMEQQSSRVLPLVAFDEYISVFGLNSKISDPRSLVKNYFADWADVQHSNGGFPYWPDDTKNESMYVSIRIAHIYAMALKRGYSSGDLKINISNLKRYISRNISSESSYMKAYACYVFSMLNDSNLDYTLKQLESEAETDLDIAAYCGLAWANKGTAAGKETAEKYREIIRNYLRPNLRSVDITQPASTSWYWYRRYTDQNALILQLYVTLDPQNEMVDRLLFSLLEDQRDGYWQSTVTTAKVLESIYTLIKMRKLDTTDFVAKATIMQNEILSSKFKGVAAKPVDTKKAFSDALLKGLPRDQNIELKFTANGTGTLYYTAEMAYALPDEIQNKRDEGIEVVYQLLDENGKEVSTSGAVVALETGKTYTYKVTLNTTKNRDHVALRCPIPSGAEVLDSTFVTSGSEASGSTTDEDDYGWWWSDWSSQKIYDNEVQYFWDDLNEGSKTVSFTFRTARRGVYPVTPVMAECMYEPEIFGRSDGFLYTIK